MSWRLLLAVMDRLHQGKALGIGERRVVVSFAVDGLHPLRSHGGHLYQLRSEPQRIRFGQRLKDFLDKDVRE